MNMTADIYTQKNIQSDSGAVTRQWEYDRTIFCKITVPKYRTGDTKSYGTGPEGYKELVDAHMQSPIKLSKRWRITNIKSSDHENVFVEPDKINFANTIFDVHAMHPVLDPFGKIAYYEIDLRRAQVQNNDIYSS
jgi:hypothetical protein